MSCQVCTLSPDHTCIWMNSACYVSEEVMDRWFAREDYNDVFALQNEECPQGLDSLNDESWCEQRMRSGPYIPNTVPATREYRACEPFDYDKCPNLCHEIDSMGITPDPRYVEVEKTVAEVDCGAIMSCQVCTLSPDHTCIWMNSACYVSEEVMDRWFAREDYNDVFALQNEECPQGLDSLNDESWCEQRMRSGPYIPNTVPATREYRACEPFDYDKCPNLCHEIDSMGITGPRY